LFKEPFNSIEHSYLSATKKLAGKLGEGKRKHLGQGDLGWGNNEKKMNFIEAE